jgi:hypothetical protein
MAKTTEKLSHMVGMLGKSQDHLLWRFVISAIAAMINACDKANAPQAPGQIGYGRSEHQFTSRGDEPPRVHAGIAG